METKKKEQNTKAEAETFAATVKGMNRDDQLTPRPCKADKRPLSKLPLNRVLTGSASLKTWPRCKNTPPSLA